MVGVQLLEGRMRAATLGLTGQQDASSSAARPSLMLASSSQLQAQQQPMRPYRIEAATSQVQLLRASRALTPLYFLRSVNAAVQALQAT